MYLVIYLNILFKNLYILEKYVKLNHKIYIGVTEYIYSLRSMSI